MSDWIDSQALQRLAEATREVAYNDDQILSFYVKKDGQVCLEWYSKDDSTQVRSRAVLQNYEKLETTTSSCLVVIITFPNNPTMEKIAVTPRADLVWLTISNL